MVRCPGCESCNIVANGECYECGRGRVPRQSARTGGGEGGFVAREEEWEKQWLWELQATD